MASKIRIAYYVLFALIAAAALVLAAALVHHVLRPDTGRLNTRLEEWRNQEKELTQLRTDWQEWSTAAGSHAAFTSAYLLKRSELRVLRTKINELVAANTLIVTGQDFATKADPPLTRVDIRLQVTGGYAGLKKFIYDVASFPKILFIRSIEFTAGGDQIHAVFAMEAYLAE